MAQVPLLGGAYEARSVIADAQRCINLFPEINPKESPAPVTHYPTPGLKTLVQPQVAPVRGLKEANNGNLYAVVGQNVYYINQNWQAALLGQLAAPKTTPVGMEDNGSSIVIVDGSPQGYTITTGTNAFAQLNDPTGSFVGADAVGFLDTFMLFNSPGTQQFYSTLSNVLQFDPTYFASKSDYSDLLQTLAVVQRQIWLLGHKTSEVWYDAGNPLFPFAELPGVIVQHGCAAKYSPASSDLALFWLGKDPQGYAVVFRGQGYQVKRISTHAIEQKIQSYPTVADAIGFTYQQGGHYFYVLSFPTADATWVWDEATQLWHQRCWMDQDGRYHRVRYQCGCTAYGKNVVGDWSNGKIYQLDTGTYQDDGQVIPRVRSFPHLPEAILLPNGRITGMFRRMMYNAFIADIETGTDAALTPGQLALGTDPSKVGGTLQTESGLVIVAEGQQVQEIPYASLRWSDDRGRSWGNPVSQPLGTIGQTRTTPTWRRLGVARDRVFELSWAQNAPSALNGAYVDGTPLAT